MFDRNLTVGELIEALSDFDPDSLVKIATQPSWPLVQAVQTVTELPADYDDDDEETRDGPQDEDDTERDVPSVVWLACDQRRAYDESPYAPRAAWGGDG